MKTVSISAEQANPEWFVVDLSGKTVGRVAAAIATILRGKNKPTFTPNADTGDFVIAINASKLVFTGTKLQKKVYYRHTHNPGGLVETPAAELLADHPERVIEYAVRGMLPKTHLGRKQLLKFKVYAGAEHPHAAQQPKPINLG